MKKVFIIIFSLPTVCSPMNAQNVGIGTTIPLEKLSVVSNYGYGISHEANIIKLSTYIDAGGAYVGTISNHPFHFYTNNGAAQMTLNTNGNIGIGNTNPAAKFEVRHISSLSSASLLLFDNNSSNYSRLRFQNSSGVNYWDIAGLNSATNSAERLNFYNSATGDIMSITGNGNVGIGTSNPFTKLHIFKGSAGGVTPQTESHLTIENSNHLYISLLTPDSRENGVLFGLNSNNAHGGIIYNNLLAPGGLLFRTNSNVNRMVIDQNGNVGIGTTNPSEKMQVNGNVKANSFEYSTPKTFYYSMPPAAFTSTSNPTTNNSSDYVYIEHSGTAAYIVSGYYGFVAPVHLPDGATVTGLKVYFVDNSGDNLKFVLRRRLHESSIYLPMCTITTSGTPGDSDISSSTISLPVVNNQFYNFTISVDPETSILWPDHLLQIKSILITYTMPGTQ